MKGFGEIAEKTVTEEPAGAKGGGNSLLSTRGKEIMVLWKGGVSKATGTRTIHHTRVMGK